MLATFLIEITFAAYILWRYILNPTSRLVVAVLVFLAIFQGTEFAICGNTGMQGGLWSRIGYSAITMLPPLGLHLAYSIAGKKSKYLVPLAYLTAGLFIGYFAFVTVAITGQTCYANYAVFDTTKGSSLVFGAYYYGWMLTTIYLAASWLKSVKQNQARALVALTIGFLSFIVPTAAVNLIIPSTINGIPSIMCGFAVILAYLLVGKVAPEAATVKERSALGIKLPF